MKHKGRVVFHHCYCCFPERWVASLFSVHSKYKSSKPPFKFCAWTPLCRWSAGGLHKPDSQLVNLHLQYWEAPGPPDTGPPDASPSLHLSPVKCCLFLGGGTGTSTLNRSPVYNRAHTPFAHTFTARGRVKRKIWRKPTQTQGKQWVKPRTFLHNMST